MSYIDVNYLAILVAAIVSMALGAFWYSPAAFGNQWMQLMKLNRDDVNRAKEKGMNKLYTINFIGSLVMMHVLALVVGLAGAATITAGATVGFWMWLGFVATVMLGSITWENKPIRLYYINAGYQLISLLIGGAILATWP